MSRFVGYLRVVINIIIKSGFLGKFEVVDSSYAKGVKALDSTIRGMESEITTLQKALKKSNSELLVEKTRAKRLQSDLSGKVSELKTLTIDMDEKSLQVDQLESELIELRDILEEATQLASTLRGEMEKWRV